MNKFRFLLLMLFIAFLVYALQGRNMKPIEELDIAAGIGIDLEEAGKPGERYKTSASIYAFPTGQAATSIVRTGEGITLGRARGDRQRKLDKKMLIGVEKVFIIGESFAESGIENLMDLAFTGATTNDVGTVAVCGGEAKRMMEHQIIGFPSSSDFISGLLVNLKEFMFFSEDIELIDVYIMSSAEGRNLAIPFIEIKEQGIEVTGTAIFRKYKMVQKLDMDDTRMMNMMLSSNGKGAVELKKGQKKYASLIGKSKRKIECEKQNDKYKFKIDIEVSGDLLENNIYDGITSKKKVLEEYEKDVSQMLESRCKEFISKMQGEYKLDLLELGRFAAAKYDRGTGINWDEMISNSEIEVKAKVKLTGVGRGDY